MLREDGSAEARDRLQNLEELLKGMEEHASAERTLQDYLEQVALVTDVDSYDGTRRPRDADDPARGQGAGVPDRLHHRHGGGPVSARRASADGDIEEERRLCYVGMTRAMRRLYLTHALRRRVYGDFQANPRSRFIDEIPPELIDAVGEPVARGDARRRHASPARDAQLAAAPTGGAHRGGER